MHGAKRWPADVLRRAARGLVGAARATSVVVALVVLVGGCTSFYPVDIQTADGLAVVDPGAVVCVMTTAGETREFEVTEVGPACISGPAARYTSVQIATLHRLEGDTPRMLALGGVVYLVATTVGTAAFVAALLG